MTVYAQSSRTLATITDVKEVYPYYYLASASIDPAAAPHNNADPAISPDTAHNPGSRSVTVTYNGNSYIWTDVEPSLTINNNVINDTIGQLYVVECTIFSNNTYNWGPLMTSSTYAAAKAAYNNAIIAKNATDLLGGHFIYKGTNTVKQGVITTPSGAGVIQTINDDPANWGYNTWIGSNGIQLRTGEESYATLNANGLILNKGGIKAGTPGESEFIYLSTDNFNDTITGQTQGTIPIDNYVKTNWREIIGRNFAVDEDGNLYAKSAKIDGDIVASSLTINSGGTTYNGIDALNVSGYELVIEVDSTNLSYAVLYPHLYLNGSEVTGTFRSAAGTTFDNNEVYYDSNYVIVTNPVAADIDNYYISNVDYRKFIWYINDSSSGQASTHAAKGSIQANYSDRARVTYAFDDGGTEGAQEAVTITIDPSKYITRIDDNGIKIHPEVWDDNSQYVQIDGDGFTVWDNNKQIAQYGEEATIGDKSGFHIGITANYNNTGKPRLSFYRDENHEVAYISENKLYITQSVVLQQMDVGRLTGEVDAATGEVGKGLWSWKVHEINGKNNLYLKWLG